MFSQFISPSYLLNRHSPTPFSKAVRRWPEDTFFTQAELAALSQRDFVDYCIEHLWDIIAAEDGVVFDDISPIEQMDIDFRAVMRYAEVLEKIRAEAEKNSDIAIHNKEKR